MGDQGLYVSFYLNEIHPQIKILSTKTYVAGLLLHPILNQSMNHLEVDRILSPYISWGEDQTAVVGQDVGQTVPTAGYTRQVALRTSLIRAG